VRNDLPDSVVTVHACSPDPRLPETAW
jgi:hypothetical protein